MENLFFSTSKIIKGAVKSFEKFPMAIANAAAFSIIAIIRIYMDWPQQEVYNFMFNCMHWSFALGAIFSITTITKAQNRYNDKKSFLAANFLGILVTVMTFVLLYFLSGTYPEYTSMRYQVVSNLAAARVSVLIFVSFLMFIVLAGYPKEQSDFSKSLFMIQKSFFIALIYGLVIMAGTSGVAGAVKALLYKGLSSKVYGYIGSISAFLSFTIFLGYLPDFRKGAVDKQREIAQKQPRFIEVLFEYILTPIMLALTLVLILWAGKTIIEGMKVPFIRLSSIAASYAIGGILLHILITHNDSSLAKLYKRIYPIAAIFILAFEAWALVIQLSKYGLKTAEYFFVLLWIATLLSSILLIVKRERAHHNIVIITSILAIISVTPIVGYNALPVKMQVSRIRNILEDEGMFKDNKIIPATTVPEEDVREIITDGVTFLASSEENMLPEWLDKDLNDNNKFKKVFGFEQTFPKYDYEVPDYYSRTLIYLTEEVVDIRGYRWAVNMQSNLSKGISSVTIDGDRGQYEVFWIIGQQEHGIPSLKILLNEKEILQLETNEYLDRILEKYPLEKMEVTYTTLEDMSLTFETSEIKGMLVFNNIEANIDPQSGIIYYWINPNALYLEEK